MSIRTSIRATIDSNLIHGLGEERVHAESYDGRIAIDVHIGQDAKIVCEDVGHFVTVDIVPQGGNGSRAYLLLNTENLAQAIALRDAAQAAVDLLTGKLSLRPEWDGRTTMEGTDPV